MKYITLKEYDSQYEELIPELIFWENKMYKIENKIESISERLDRLSKACIIQ